MCVTFTADGVDEYYAAEIDEDVRSFEVSSEDVKSLEITNAEFEELTIDEKRKIVEEEGFADNEDLVSDLIFEGKV